jgi:outer membrane protein assembly factor BamB
MFRSDPQLNGVTDAPPPRRLDGVRFVFRTGAAIRSTPALSQGVLYFGSGDGNVYALDSRSGAVRWRIAADGPVSASPAVADGMVFFTTRGASLWAVGAADGRTRWKHAFGKDLGEQNYWDF